jgi:antitoxin VapB
MALNIKDPETDRLARELAAATGETITTAIRTAIEERLCRQRARAAVHAEFDDLLDLVSRGRARTVLDHRPAAEILGYDENGLPR